MYSGDECLVYHSGTRLVIKYIGKEPFKELYEVRLEEGEWCSDEDVITLCHNTIRKDISIHKVRHWGGEVECIDEYNRYVKVHLW